MRKIFQQPICLFLSLVLALTWMLSACGGQSAPPETTAPMQTVSTSAPTEVTVETTAVETEPTETVPPETEPTFVTVNGITYDSRLGEPVLGEDAVKQLARAKNHAAAAEQITNLGDALYYMQNATINSYVESFIIFADLLAHDYDEVGMIELSSDRSSNFYSYVKQDGIFYTWESWPGAPTSGTDLDSICEEMMRTCDQSQFGEPMTACGHTAICSDELIQVDGIPYAAVLGEPVLGKAAATELAKSGDIAAAAEQINNVGDAIYYMQAVKLKKTNDALTIACNLFAGLLGDDYDEVGIITLETTNSRYGFVYIQQDGIYYQFDPCEIYNRGMGIGFLPSGPAYAADLDSLCEKMLASCTYIRHDDPLAFYTTLRQFTSATPVTQEEKVVAYLTTPQYTKEQIEAWVEEGLTVEQWAEKIKVPADAVQLLGAINYHEKDYNDNILFEDKDNGIIWGGMWNAQEVFARRSGGCGGTSNLMNFLLSGDFEEQGYVEYTSSGGGHIFNYFVYDGIYIMCDFTNLFGPYLGDFPNTSGYVEYVGSDVQGFSNYYLYQSYFTADFFNPDRADYLYTLWMYPREGAKLPKGYDKQRKETKWNHVWNILPEQYKDLFVILYEDENNPLLFYPAPPEDQWPDTIK